MDRRRTIKPGQERPGARRTPLVRAEFDPLPGPGRPAVDPARMSMPYRCNGCGTVYDGGRVTVTGRYADCDVWKAPCCGATHDNRRAWSGAPGARMGYTDLRERDRVLAERGVTPWGER